MTERETAPRSFTIPALLVFAAGIAAVSAESFSRPPVLRWELLLLLAAGLLSENFAVNLRGFSVSLAFPLVLCALLLFGPASAALVAATGFTNLSELRSRRPFRILAFNLGQFLLWSTAAGWIYIRLGGPVMSGLGVGATPMTSSTAPDTLLPLLVASLVGSLLNMFLAAVGVSILKNQPYMRVITTILQYLPTQLTIAFVGILMAQVMAIQPYALVALLAPLFLARRVYQSYASMQSTYLDTIRSLVGALEARDAYTRGHSERVSAYACAIGRSMGLSEDELETVQTAALLHDIGKLAVSPSLLSKPGSLTAHERQLVEAHPLLGGELARRIPAVEPLAESIQCHHERMDGSGYPDGRCGGAIPVCSRILAVADAFDAMTTDRPYRRALTPREAIDELDRCREAQFDSQIVAAFLKSRSSVDCEDALTSRGITSALLSEGA